MLQMVGGAVATEGAAEPNTTQWMRAAITPQRVAQIRNSSLKDISGVQPKLHPTYHRCTTSAIVAHAVQRVSDTAFWNAFKMT